MNTKIDYKKIFSHDNSALYDVVISRQEDKLSTNLEDETIILDITEGIYSQLNPVGTTIWETLEKPLRFSDILTQIVSTYSISEEECIQDILDFLISMAENNLILINHDSLS